MSRAPLKAIIFDMDGVLYDSTPSHRTAYARMFKEMGLTDVNYEDIAGMRTDQAISTVLKKRRMPFSPTQLKYWTARKQSLSRALLGEGPRLRSGAMRLLKALRSRFLIGLASSAERRKIHGFLTASRTRRFFSAVVAGDEVLHAKPHPEIYKKTAAALHVKPKQVLVIEDAVSGVRSARRAGARVAGVRGTSPAAELRRAGAEIVFRHLLELVPYAARH